MLSVIDFSQQSLSGELRREAETTRPTEVSEIPNHKYQTNHNDQNSKFQTCFLFWSLKLGTRPQGGESGGPILEFDILQGSTAANAPK
jgi:hypothetical protein